MTQNQQFGETGCAPLHARLLHLHAPGRKASGNCLTFRDDEFVVVVENTGHDGKDIIASNNDDGDEYDICKL